MKYRIVITVLFLAALFAAYALRSNDAPTATPASNSTPAAQSTAKPADDGIHLN